MRNVPITIGGAVWLCLIPSLCRPNAASALLRSQGDQQEYNLYLDQALKYYSEAAAADPGDPAAYRAVAATYFMKIAFLRGAVTADDFLGDEVRMETLDMPKPPADLAAAFHENAQHALRLAEQQVHAQPDNADAHYQLGSAIALLASYSATIEGQVFGAFKLARRAYKENSRALELDPARHDAGLIVGVYEYLVSTRSRPVRWLARLSGLDDDKGRGIDLMERAARYPGENQTDAGLALILIYNRERRYADALDVLSKLKSRYPDNRLLWLEAGSTALRAGQYKDATHLLDRGFVQLSHHPPLLAFGEEALWRYKRGASLVASNRTAEATADLRAALEQAGRDWVHGRANAELGKIADLAGNRPAARHQYQVAAQLAKRADDSMGLADAERLLRTPYHALSDAAAARNQ